MVIKIKPSWIHEHVKIYEISKESNEYILSQINA
jgi:hypothetical protein